MRHFTLLPLFLLAACIDPSKAARDSCRIPYEAAQERGGAHAEEAFAQCKTERVMPHFIALHPGKETEIRQLYREMEQLAARYDRGDIDRSRMATHWVRRYREFGLEDARYRPARIYLH